MVVNIKGYDVIIDDEDSEIVLSRSWYLKPTKGKNVYFCSGHSGAITLHRIIMGLHKYDKIFIDHINGNTLDCRKENLRFATPSQNCQNKGARIDNTTGYKGVSYYKKNKKWGANIMVDKKYLFLGLHETPESAYEAYCNAAVKYHGEYARVK